MTLPKRHIDTSVIVEPESTKEGRQCKRYLQKLGYNYTGVLSFPVLSELFVILASIEDFNERYDFLESILATIKSRSIMFYSPKDISMLLREIKLAEARIGNTDQEILACVSEDKSYALVTLDKDMLNNKKLESLLRIKILHPKDLV